MSLSDPKRLATLPLPIRTLLPQIPHSLLSTVLESHADAYTPQSCEITALTPTHITISYLQPPREQYFKPVPRTVRIPFDPPLPKVPLPDKSKKEDETSESYVARCLEWETTVADRLKEMERIGKNKIEGRTDLAVTRFIWPQDTGSVVSLTFFLLLTFSILAWVSRRETAPLIGPFLATYIFPTEWRLNAAVLLHCSIILRKASDMFRMAELLRKHRVDLKGDYRKVWTLWMLSSALEGWRGIKRFEAEVGRVGREKAMESAEKDAEGKKRR